MQKNDLVLEFSGAPQGAFFVPYVIFFVCCGIPVFFLETALGQFTSEGGITCWRKVCPLFEGDEPLSILLIKKLQILKIERTIN